MGRELAKASAQLAGLLAWTLTGLACAAAPSPPVSVEEGLRGLSAGARELFAKYEAQALRKGWRRKEIEVDGRERQLMWTGPKGRWARGAIIAMHGGGGTYSNYACGVRLGRPMEEFAGLAVKKGFAVISPDSTFNGAADAKGRKCGKRWDCTAVGGRANVDLPFIRKIVEEVIPELRPAGSGRGVFMTGISNGGFMTILAATSMPGRITAFAPVSCGDPYGTHMDMGTHPRLERANAPGVFRDNGTGRTISTLGAAGSGPYRNEKKWPEHKLERMPGFRQFQDRNDGCVDFSLAVKARDMLVRHGYRDAGALFIRGGRRSVWLHFWQRAYNRPMLAFFEEQARGLENAADPGAGGEEKH